MQESFSLASKESLYSNCRAGSLYRPAAEVGEFINVLTSWDSFINVQEDFVNQQKLLQTSCSKVNLYRRAVAYKVFLAELQCTESQLLKRGRRDSPKTNLQMNI